MAEKVTNMKLEVNLECDKCFKKVKKVLAKYPQIRDQKFDHKENIVLIKVVCCSPEKIRDKLCNKGGGSIKSIEILLDPPKPKSAEPDKKKDADKPKPPEPDKKKEPEKDKPKEKSKEPEKPKPAEPEKKKDGGGDKPKDKPPESKPKGGPEKPKDKPAEPKPAPPQVKLPDPIPAYPPPGPPPVAVPVGMCVGPYYGDGGPCVNGYVGPPVCYEGYYARPVYDSYGGGRPYYVSRCDQYFSEENPQGCTIM